jgi:hypothetical protein
MRELLAKIGRFCENHVEKIVLIIIGPICVWLFFTRVIFSPNAVPYGGKMLSPGQIDEYVDRDAGELRDALVNVGSESEQKPYTSLITGPIEPNNPVVAEVFTERPAPQSFLGLFKDPLSFIDTDVTPIRQIRDDNGRRYALPVIGPVTEVKVNHIRAAAYVPLAPVTSQTGYGNVESEPNDIDLVTVEARFDVAELYRQFHAYFAGTEVEEPEWRDPCLAVPRFAAVELQRQVQLDDGTWSNEWVSVPRSRVEQHRALFKPIEKVQDLPPGGVKVREMQFKNKFITMALLQPEAYQIASAEDDWLPPTFHEKFKTLQRKVEMEQRRQEREERQEQKESTTTTGGRRDDARGTGRTNRVGGGTTRRGTIGGDTGMYGGGDRRGNRSTRTRGRTDTANETVAGGRTRSSRRGGAADGALYDVGGMYGRGEDGTKLAASTDEAYLDFYEAQITYTTDLSKLKEPLLFWAFDDTADPGKTYRYRIRLGVFNPVAGTNELIERDMGMRDQVILWSAFSNVTPEVAIPRRLYFFAKNVQDRARAATVEVARYALGYWYTQDFQVHPGEVIGREMEPPKKKDEDKEAASRLNDRITGMAGRGAGLLDPRAMDFQPKEPEDPTTPEMVDYGTGTMLVDVVEAGDLGSPPNLQPRPYHDMLYTKDGVTIEHMPVSQKNWPADLQQAYQQIASERNKEHQEFRAFRANRSRGMDGRGGGLYGGLYGG